MEIYRLAKLSDEYSSNKLLSTYWVALSQRESRKIDL